MSTLLLALGAIGLSVAAQFTLKAGMSSPAVHALTAGPFGARALCQVLLHPNVVGGLFLYGAGAVIWLGVLAKWDVSKAYPLVGFGFAAPAILGIMAGEQVSSMRAAGIALICGGVFLVARS